MITATKLRDMPQLEIWHGDVSSGHKVRESYCACGGKQLLIEGRQWYLKLETVQHSTLLAMQPSYQIQ